MNYLTDTQIKKLHKKYAPNQDVFDLIYSHCKIVWEVAQEIISNKNLKLDAELIRVGCQLHDIGVYKLYMPDGTFYDPKTYVSHGPLGQEIVESENLGKTLGILISRHTGVGITKSDIEANKLPLPPKDFVPITIEERLVCYADKFHSKETPSIFWTYKSYKKHIRKYGEDKVKLFAEMHKVFGEPNVKALSAKYNQGLR